MHDRRKVMKNTPQSKIGLPLYVIPSGTIESMILESCTHSLGGECFTGLRLQIICKQRT